MPNFHAGVKLNLTFKFGWKSIARIGVVVWVAKNLFVSWLVRTGSLDFHLSECASDRGDPGSSDLAGQGVMKHVQAAPFVCGCEIIQGGVLHEA
jgi:hypothetical protein